MQGILAPTFILPAASAYTSAFAPAGPCRMPQAPSSRSVSPTEALSRIREKGLPLLLRALSEALANTEQWLEQYAAKQQEKDQADDTAKDRDVLHQGKRAASETFGREWLAAVSALTTVSGRRSTLDGLSLIDDESLDLHLAHESFVESIARRYRVGIEALDQRLASVMGGEPLGVRMPLSSQVLANAVHAAIKGFDVEPTIRGMLFRNFEEELGPELSVLLNELNAWLAAAGVLPHLVIPPVEQRRAAKKPAAAAASENAAAAATPEPPPVDAGAPVRPTAGPEDRAMFDTLVGLLQNLNAQRSQAQGAAGARPPTGRPMESLQTISVLDMLQRDPPADLLAALGSGEGSLAEVLKRQVSQSAQKLGMNKDDTHLGPAEETAVDLVGNLFDVMARERPYGEVAKPMLGRMVMPFTKAAVMDPELFVQPDHPARRLLNTVSEACEDNLGESAQERELLGHVEHAIEQLNAEFDNDLAPFESIEKKLSGQMASHRRRVGLAERREAEAQRGQERLELARNRASDCLQTSLSNREMPAAIREFLLGHWQHHLTMVALRHPEDSPAWREAVAVARPWLDFCDMASLGEPVPADKLQALRPATEVAMNSSGVHGQAADLVFEGMSRALADWAEHGADLPAAAPAPVVAAPEPRFPPASTQRLPSDAAATAAAAPAPAAESLSPLPLMKPSEAALAQDDPLAVMLAEQDPPTEEELEEIRKLPMNVWLQLPKSANELQVVKLSWVSGVSGLMMFVNRRGARVLVASPAEMALWKRQGRMHLFERNTPVDQAMSQVVDRLRRQVSAA